MDPCFVSSNLFLRRFQTSLPVRTMCNVYSENSEKRRLGKQCILGALQTDILLIFSEFSLLRDLLGFPLELLGYWHLRRDLDYAVRYIKHQRCSELLWYPVNGNGCERSIWALFSSPVRNTYIYEANFKRFIWQLGCWSVILNWNIFLETLVQMK